MKSSQSNNNKISDTEQVEILSLMDNSIDFLSITKKKYVQTFRQWTRKQYGQEWSKNHFLSPIAEHGFSALIRIIEEEKKTTILFDTGQSPNGIIINARRMGIDLSEVDCIVLSHGHYDHFGGLLASFKKIGNPKLPIFLHRDVFKIRGKENPDGTISEYPKFPIEKQTKLANLKIIKKPLRILNEKVLLTGEIPRKTVFEKGYQKHRVLINGSWRPDPWIWDDQALIVKPIGKGLVVISGCAHSGIINTLNYAQKITGINNIYAVFGGFHLAGKQGEKIIQQTTEEIKRINTKFIIPAHCTGLRAKCSLTNNMPKKVIWNNVGNLYKF